MRSASHAASLGTWTSIAVTGASGVVGQRLLPVLADEPSAITRLVGLDVRPPRRRVRDLEFHLVDIARLELKPLLEGTDVLIHLATVVDPIPDESLMASVNVDGTRRVLDAAADVGVRKVVRVSSAAVYGAWANNPVPLTEDCAAAAQPGVLPRGAGRRGGAAPRRLARRPSRRRRHDAAQPRRCSASAPSGSRRRLLLGRPPLRIRGAAPPVQAVHVDDLVAALALLVVEDHPGTFNVASDGWLEPAALQALGAARAAALPAGPARRGCCA